MASEDLLKKAVATFNALSPEQQAEMLEEQRQSWVRGNIGLSRDERGMTSPVMPQPTTVMVSELKPWRYEIKYGPDGEDAYSWVYDDHGAMVATMKTHKAKQIVDAMNTRPAPVDANLLASNPVDDKIAPDTDGNAPAATDTGLVTYAHDNGTLSGLSRNEHGPWCLRSQAEELLAAERAEKARLKLENEAQADQINELEMTPWPEWASKVLAVIRKRSGYDGYDDTTEGVDLPAELDECMAALEADNAELTARIKELKEDHDHWVQENIRNLKKAQGAEAKFSAAEKALKPFSYIAGELFAANFNNDDVVFKLHRRTADGLKLSYKMTAKAFFEARAVLGGKPS